MANIYLRVPTYVAQFYRGLDATRQMSEFEPYKFCEFQHEYIWMKNMLRLIPETEQTSSWCYSQRAWNNMLGGKSPAGGKIILHRDRTVWPSINEICAMTGEKKIQKMDGYDYLCLQMPQDVVYGNQLHHTNGSYNLSAKNAIALQRLLRDEFVHTFLDWLIQERRYCNQIGLHREIGQTIERFFERYYIFIGATLKERDSMYRMSRRWVDQARILPNDRVDFSNSDIHYISERESERLEPMDFEREIDKGIVSKEM